MLVWLAPKNDREAKTILDRKLASLRDRISPSSYAAEANKVLEGLVVVDARSSAVTPLKSSQKLYLIKPIRSTSQKGWGRLN